MKQQSRAWCCWRRRRNSPPGKRARTGYGYYAPGRRLRGDERQSGEPRTVLKQRKRLLTISLHHGIVGATEERFGKPAERPGRKARCLHGAYPHDRPAAIGTETVSCCSRSFVFSGRRFSEKRTLSPLFHRDVHIPQPERPPACGGQPLRRVRGCSGGRRRCVCAGTVPAGRTAEKASEKAPKASGFGRFFARRGGGAEKKRRPARQGA